MVEPISITALIVAIISAAGVLIKTIGDAIAKSSCTSTTISSTGSVRKKTFNGTSESEQT